MVGQPKKTTTITSQDCVFRQCSLALYEKAGLLAYCLHEAQNPLISDPTWPTPRYSNQAPI